ncbi:reverse transcriptase domain-containing protein [Tanacetum coccineum]
MERGLLSSGGRGVKQKKGGGNDSDYGNVIGSGIQNLGNGGDVNSPLVTNMTDFGNASHTHIDHNKGGASDIDYAANVSASSNETFTDPVIKQATVEACMSFETAMRGAKDATSMVVAIMPTNVFPSPKSFAGLVKNEANISKVNFRVLDMGKPNNAKAEVQIPKPSILEPHARFGFSLYGYFVGKRVAFPIVEYYVKNVWKNYGIVRVMMNAKGFFFFKFASIEEYLNSVPIWVKLYDILIVAFTADDLSAMATKLGKSIMLDSTDRELKEEMVIAIPHVEDVGEVLHSARVEYKWKPLRCGMCMIFGHDDMLCPKRVVRKPMNNGFRKDKGKGQTSGADDEGFIEVKKKKSSGNNGDTKNFTILVKPKTQYRLKEKQSFEGRETLQRRLLLLVVASGSMATTSGTQEEEQSTTPIVDKINILEKQILEGKLVLVDDDGKPLEKVDYPGDLGNDDVVKPVDNVMATFLASKSIGFGYGLKSLLEQWREDNVVDDYDPYDDDMYEGQEILGKIQTICNNLDITVCGRKKK